MGQDTGERQSGIPSSGSLLVTGASGFIGGAVVRVALAHGLQVTGLCRKPVQDAQRVSGVDYVYADITQADALKQCLANRQFDYVINSAVSADHSGYYLGGRAQIHGHFFGLMNLIDCVNHEGLKSFIQIGSSDEYGNAPSPQTEDCRERPMSLYSCAKTAAGQLIETLHRTEGFPGTVARLFLIYGPGPCNQKFMPQVIGACLKDENVPVSKGEQLRDFCYVDDIAEGLLTLLGSDRVKGETLNVASGVGVAVRDVIKKIQQIVNGGHPLYGELPYRPGESMSLYADISKIKRLTNWRPHTDFTTGLDMTIDWYRKQLGIA